MHHLRYTLPFLATATSMAFDPDAFMNQTVDAPLESEYKLVPVAEYRAMIDDFTSEAIIQREFTYKQGPKTGQPGVMTIFICPFILDAPQVAADLNRTKLVVTRDYILDIDENTGKLATGPNRNVPLGQLRKAVGQEATPNWVIPMLRNQGPVMVKVIHKNVKGASGDFTKAEVDRVAGISS